MCKEEYTMRISDYQKQTMQTCQFSSKRPEEQEQIILHGLVGEIGDMLSCVKKKIRDGEAFRGFKPQMTEEIGDILWYLAAVGNKYDIDLAEAAKQNLKKTQTMFSSDESTPPFYDEEFPECQQLPRQLTIKFACEDDKVILYRDGHQIGDKLSDNAYHDDGYRFHDVFHLAYAAMLGWSPILRRLLKVKRKDSGEIDEVEDGARGGLTEELISLFVYMSSQEQGADYNNPEVIDIAVIRMIKAWVGGLEVCNRTDTEWRRAISEGFKIFDKLRENKGGLVSYDMKQRKISYSPRKPKND